jgi:pimeloyl-ACP methyl ester carboxylesterase
MSPIILIHGNNSNGGFFVRQGFTLGLDDAQLLWDNSISLPTGLRAVNGQLLATSISSKARSFGVDSIHVVAHSKGGLDAREYLQHYYAAQRYCFVGPVQGAECDSKCPNDQAICRLPVTVLSFTTLSTPHNGSVGADIEVTRSIVANLTSDIDFVGFPSMTNALSWLLPDNAGYPDLRTTTCAFFNEENVPQLRQKAAGTQFHTFGADADKNLNGRMDPGWLFASDVFEVWELGYESPVLRELPPEGAADVVDVFYQAIRNAKSIKVRTEWRYFDGVYVEIIANVIAVPAETPQLNDTLVTIDSAAGVGNYDQLVSRRRTYNHGTARNHASIANRAAATNAAKWIVDTERAIGDFR